LLLPLSIKREIQNYWQELITSMASYYQGLKYLNSADYRPGNIHPLLKVKCSSSIEISRIFTKTENVNRNIYIANYSNKHVW
jgi:hypothetical protein